MINDVRFTTFATIYKAELRKAVAKHPNEYRYTLAEADEVAERMLIGIRRGSANKDSRAIKATCKALNIKHTYKAIANYLLGGFEYAADQKKLDAKPAEFRA